MISCKMNTVGANIFPKNNIPACQIVDSPVLSNTTSQESSSFDDTNRTSPSPLKNKENLIDAKSDGPQTETQSTITRIFSRSKSFTEDLQSKQITKYRLQIIIIGSDKYNILSSSTYLNTSFFSFINYFC
jgi:hypothetical protein